MQKTHLALLEVHPKGIAAAHISSHPHTARHVCTAIYETAQNEFVGLSLIGTGRRLRGDESEMRTAAVKAQEPCFGNVWVLSPFPRGRVNRNRKQRQKSHRTIRSTTNSIYYCGPQCTSTGRRLSVHLPFVALDHPPSLSLVCASIVCASN